MRLSTYTLSFPIINGHYLLINGLNGALDIVDSTVFNNLSQNTFDKFDANFIDTLQRRGHLTMSTATDEQLAFESAVSRLEHIEANRANNVFSIIPTYNCNFKCPYCFEQNNDVRKSRGIVMSKETVDLCYQSILASTNSHNRYSKTILLFGGEPLLGENYEIVSYIVHQGASLGFEFSAISNGYDLDAYGELLSPDLINYIQVTLDGDKFTHNKRRIHRSQKDSFDKILENIEYAVQRGINMSIRINVDSENKDSIEPLIKLLKDRQLFGLNNLGIYVAFISGEDNFNPSEYNCSLNYLSYEDFTKKAFELDTQIGVETSLYNRLRKP